MVERCAQETDADVLTQIYRTVSYCYLTVPVGQTASSLEALVEAALHGLNVRVRSVACHAATGLLQLHSLSRLSLPLSLSVWGQHCDVWVVSAAILMVDRIGDLYRGRGCDVDELYFMYVHVTPHQQRTRT